MKFKKSLLVSIGLLCSGFSGFVYGPAAQENVEQTSYAEVTRGATGLPSMIANIISDCAEYPFRLEQVLQCNAGCIFFLVALPDAKLAAGVKGGVKVWD